MMKISIKKGAGSGAEWQSDNGVFDVSFQLQRGRITVITGKIGAGKTTLLRAILGHLPPQEGKILWNGEEVAEPVTFLTPPHCAYTPQVPVLFQDTWRENVKLGKTIEEDVWTSALYHAVLEEDIERLPLGADTDVGPAGSGLSGGQQQRTAIARMFAQCSPLVVMDDSSSAIDLETERKLWQRLKRRTDLTCLIASHKRECLQIADHIIVLHNGTVEAEGTLADLLQHSETMRQLYYRE